MKDTKEMSKLAFQGSLVIAGLSDLISTVIPGTGTVFIGLARLTFWLEGYNARNTMATTAVNALVEAVPAISAIPSSLLFVTLFYLKNKANVLEDKLKAGPIPEGVN